MRGKAAASPENQEMLFMNFISGFVILTHGLYVVSFGGSQTFVSGFFSFAYYAINEI